MDSPPDLYAAAQARGLAGMGLYRDGRGGLITCPPAAARAGYKKLTYSPSFDRSRAGFLSVGVGAPTAHVTGSGTASQPVAGSYRVAGTDDRNTARWEIPLTGLVVGQLYEVEVTVAVDAGGDLGNAGVHTGAGATGTAVTNYSLPAGVHRVRFTASLATQFLNIWTGDALRHGTVTVSDIHVMGVDAVTGRDLYPWTFFDFNMTQADHIIFNPEGTITVLKNAIVSAAQVVAGSSFVGKAFGGGLYAEAEFRFNTPNKGPAWWSMAAEHLVGLPSQQWPGQAPGYHRFIEPDFAEFYPPYAGPNGYFGDFHDWHGAGSPYTDVSIGGATTKTVPTANPGVNIIDWDAYHRYGWLWVPATALRQGHAKWFFDGVEVGETITWDLHNPNISPPPTGAQRWSVLDAQHLILSFGMNADNVSVPGVETATIKGMNVWQASEAGNWSF